MEKTSAQEAYLKFAQGDEGSVAGPLAGAALGGAGGYLGAKQLLDVPAIEEALRNINLKAKGLTGVVPGSRHGAILGLHKGINKQKLLAALGAGALGAGLGYGGGRLLSKESQAAEEADVASDEVDNVTPAILPGIGATAGGVAGGLGGALTSRALAALLARKAGLSRGGDTARNLLTGGAILGGGLGATGGALTGGYVGRALRDIGD